MVCGERVELSVSEWANSGISASVSASSWNPNQSLQKVLGTLRAALGPIPQTTADMLIRNAEGRLIETPTR